MTTKLIESWSEWTMVPCQHRIFKATEPCMLTSLPRTMRSNKSVAEFGAWAVADNSGSTPERTDDGILWLNFQKNIMLCDDRTILIPVIAPDGSMSSFVTNPAGLFYLMDKFRWTANVMGTMYRVVRW